MKHVSNIIALAMLAAVSLRAGEVPDKTEKKIAIQPSTYRPFKELQDVLFFEGFEKAEAPAFEHGKIVTGSTEDPHVPPGAHVWKMETNKDNSFVFLHLVKTPVKMPLGLNPTQIQFQFSFYADEAGSLNIKFIHEGGDYSREIPVPKVKTWTAVTMKLSEMRNKDKMPEPEHVIKEFELRVKAKGKGAVPKAWIDDVIFTYNINPADVRPRLALAEKKRTDMEKTSTRDGYAYSMALNDFLKTTMKAAKQNKNKHVLVMASTPELTETWVKQMAAAAPKAKDTLVFDQADDPTPGKTPIGGLADMRTLLLYNFQKEPEMALLVLSAEDALSPGRPTDSVRVIVERSLSAGIVPVVCVPSATKAEDKDKVATFVKTVEGICAQFGAPMIDAGFFTRNAKGEFDATKLSSLSVEKTAQLAAGAIKHVRDSLNAKD